MIDKQNDLNGLKKVEDGVILNTDLNAVKKYKLQKKRFSELAETREEVKQLKEDMSEIKNMLSQLININNKNQD